MTDNDRRAQNGADVVLYGTPRPGEDLETEAADVITNILHYVNREAGDTERTITLALMHFRAERDR